MMTRLSFEKFEELRRSYTLELCDSIIKNGFGDISRIVGNIISTTTYELEEEKKKERRRKKK